MSIWVYEDWEPADISGLSDREAHDIIGTPSKCPYCGGQVAQVDVRVYKEWHLTRETHTRWASACNSCGWWVVSEASSVHWMEDQESHRGLVLSTLKDLDVSDLSLPTDDLRRYLLSRYDERFTIHPRRYEELVGDVFRGLGYYVRVTGYSRDDGIDIFMFDGPGDVVEGIQVKRQRGKVQAYQIRELGGALILNGLTSGIFVTTSDYTRGASSTARRFGARGLPIQLINAQEFYDRMKIVSRSPYERGANAEAPFASLLAQTQLLPGPTVFISGE